MNRALDELITSYVDAAGRLFPRVAEYVGVTLPISNRDWALLQIDYRGRTPEGISYFKHGYGVAMSDGQSKVDLDIGASGQIDGFDAWRLFNYAENSRVETSFRSHKEVNEAILEAQEAGELKYSGYILYYRT